MIMQTVRKLAAEFGINNAGKLSKPVLIREIQKREGNFDCFGTARKGYCDQGACLWKEDCFRNADTEQ